MLMPSKTKSSFSVLPTHCYLNDFHRHHTWKLQGKSFKEPDNNGPYAWEVRNSSLGSNNRACLDESETLQRKQVLLLMRSVNKDILPGVSGAMAVPPEYVWGNFQDVPLGERKKGKEWRVSWVYLDIKQDF